MHRGVATVMFSVIVGLRDDFLLSAKRVPALYGSFSRRPAPQLQVPAVARPRNQYIQRVKTIHRHPFLAVKVVAA